MLSLTVDPANPDSTVIARAADILRGGGVVAYPTDTLYGLAVDPTNDTAVDRLFAVKERDTGSAIALIAADLRQARTAGEFLDIDLRLAETFWPGPLTIVVPASPAICALLTAKDRTIGVRVPAHAVARSIAAALGLCITATSANRSGLPAATTPEQVRSTLADRIDCLVDGGSAPGGLPSTIVRAANGRIDVLRAGAIASERVLESLQ